MAKWGEGDPRWIVEQREDGKNVNNWHWSEKNASQWSKDTIKKLLLGLVHQNDEVYFEICDISKLEGEATANNRKGKVIVFYEWDLEVDWKGYLKSGDNKTEFKGKITVPNLSEENDASELDVNVTTEKNTVSANKVKEFVRLNCSNKIREQLGKYIADLKTEYTKGLILPTKNIVSTEAISTKFNSCKEALNEVVVTNELKEKATSKKYCRLDLEEEFFCTPNDLYQVFLDGRLVSAFSRSPATVDAVVGGHFKMFGDTITGIIDKLECPSMIMVRWRHKSWIKDHFSTVVLNMKATDAGTVLTLSQEGIPDSELNTTKNGWLQHYFHAIKMTFGYGGRMF